ncbi:16S rRNA (cytidine(1402)-2'-O)-methyltransferase [Irregularibacter muris]|uniref:Ribosomal RNA small subunit methyltransferase I n=1 Tax=Irregularibacter muris TaxID=1796619 RepID=A0AAE3HI36_9FIRM|nr:16S rRNA (cytidine(1402)-2'-O)-methyltransferase [Irregularibacter muris]MCR1899533.1 16S rRNA (cytidine(1402)-2'-O)-methyltransferase [Irregularibacter muris]
MNEEKIGTMYFCSTPIGNLEDITLRVLNTLKKVDLIAAEDTRHTVKLLNHFELRVPLTSYHQHNEKSKADELIDLLKQGKNIAVVSDAGMPGISDPGEELVQRCIEEDLPFTLLPGANAALTALVLSGLPTRYFVFEGFLSRDKNERSIQLERAEKETRTMIFYESPHRILNTLKILREHLGNRSIALGRELTKQYEEIWRGPIEEALEEFQTRKPRGEFVLVVKGLSQEALEEEKREQWEKWSIVEHLEYYMEQGNNKKDAMKIVAKDRGLSKREIYQYTIENKEK